MRGPEVKMRPLEGRACSRGGSALILALFVVVGLAVLVASIAVDAKLELKYAGMAKRRRQCESLALSGIEVAKMLMDKQASTGVNDQGDDDDRWFEAAQRLAKGQPIHGLIVDMDDGQAKGQIILDIAPEPGRRNVNLLDEGDWERILGNAGVPEDYWPMLIDSFFDWLDADDNARADGAESEDYYEKLDPPYSAKNGTLDTVRELLLIRGFTEAILSGGELIPDEMDKLSSSKSRFSTQSRFADTNAIYVSGIENLLTTYGDGKVNVQSASADVLMTLPDVDDVTAGAIIEERGDFDDPDDENAREPYASPDDLFARVPGLSSELMSKITTKSEYFRITSIGRIGSTERKMWGIVHSSNGRVRFLRWCEEP